MLSSFARVPVADLRAVPTLDELAARPELAAELPADVVRSLFLRVAAVQAALSAALVPWRAAEASARPEPSLVDVDAAARAIGVAPSWLAEQARRGTFRSYKSGHYRRYEVCEVIEDFKALTRTGDATIHRVYDRRRAAQGT